MNLHYCGQLHLQSYKYLSRRLWALTDSHLQRILNVDRNDSESTRVRMTATGIGRTQTAGSRLWKRP